MIEDDKPLETELREEAARIHNKLRQAEKIEKLGSIITGASVGFVLFLMASQIPLLIILGLSGIALQYIARLVVFRKQKNGKQKIQAQSPNSRC